MRRSLRHLSRQNFGNKSPRFFSFTRKTRNPILISISSLSFLWRRAPLRRRLQILTFGLCLLVILWYRRYLHQSSINNLWNSTKTRSSISYAEEQEAANIRCSSSRTLVEIPTHSLASLDCFRASRNGLREGLGCKTSTRRPSLLWTIPGAGNTWVRNLLEQATGVATGSVYDDSSLRKIFVGEGLCDDTTLCIKAHPSTHPFELLSDQGEDFTLSSPMLKFRNSVTKSASDALRRLIMFKRHCRPKSNSHKSGKPITFTRAVIIDRNPLEAAFAEVQRLTVSRQGRGEGSHVSRLSNTFKRDVNRRVWNRFCMDYLRLGVDYVLAWHSYVQFVQKYGKEAVYFARYEDLKDRQKRENVLRGMLNFLDAELLTGSLECAFANSKDSRIRRGSDNSSKTYTRSEEKGSSSFSHLTLADFLNSEFMGKPMIDWMWSIIGRVAEARGYDTPQGFVLSKYQRSNETKNLDVARAIGLSTKEWYYEKDKMASLRSLGSDFSTNGFDQESGSQGRVISSEYLPCLKEASLVKREGHVVLTFAGNPAGVGINDKRGVFPILLNSILWMHTAGVRELLVVCFDEEYEYLLRSLGVNTCFLELASQRDKKPSEHDRKTGGISELYSRRLAVIEALLRAEIDVVHTDTDAVWTENPFSVIRSYHNRENRRSDIVASRGTFPYKESASWGGSTLCMGLVSFRATPGVRQVLRIARQTAHKYHGDDQIGLNRGLAELGLIWLAKDQEVGVIVLSSLSSVSTTRVALLPDDIVRRNCTSGHIPHSLIMHCFDKHNASFTADKTKEFMKQRGLWLLRENWLETLISREHKNLTIETLRIQS